MAAREPGTFFARLAALLSRAPPQPSEADIVSASGMFDAAWYAARYPESGEDPLGHYLREGWRRGNDPHPLFDTDWYLEQNPDVETAGVNPLLHFIERGSSEGRDPNPLFDTAWYRANNPDVSGNAFEHYLRTGAAEGRNPHPLFKSRWYLAQYPEVREAGANPLTHYLREGAAKGYDPNPLFDGGWYLKTNPEVGAAGLNPLVHYVLRGEAEGRAPSPLLSDRWQLDNVPSPTTPSALERPPGRGRLLSPVRAGGARSGFDSLAEVSAGRTAAADDLAQAIAAAATEHRHLVITMQGISLAPNDITALLGGFDADPMVGMVAPRVLDAAGRLLPLLPSDQGSPSYDRRILEDVPTSMLVPEHLACCLIIRGSLLANFPTITGEFRALRGALRAFLAWSRRVGYRALIDNRVTVSVSAARLAYPELEPDERVTLLRLFPDVVLAEEGFARLSWHDREALLDCACSSASGPRRILFDCSGMSLRYDGTSECILGILDGLARGRYGWKISVYSSAAAIEYHGLRARYPDFDILDQLSGTFALAIRLSQPWSMEHVAQIHRHALKLAFLMLDTIAWDIIYAANPAVQPAWQLIAAQADGLIYISQFSKDRFNFRFPVAPSVLQAVTLLSSNFAEYLDGESRPPGENGHILLIGNAFEHKGLTSILDVLPAAFPDRQFVVIGHSDFRKGNVTSIGSGQIEPALVARLFAQARMLVFPSFYEGFGFPVVKGLAYGLDVMARRSDLLFEIGRQCAPRGRLIPFDDPASLVATVDRILSRQDVETVPLGGDIPPGAEAAGWRDISARVMAFAERMAEGLSIASYDRRETAIRFISPADDG